MIAVVMAAPFFASCAHPLEQIVESNHQRRVGEQYANKPIAFGAGDGLGAHAARSSADRRLTLSDKPRP
jgi:hypothetical protein